MKYIYLIIACVTLVLAWLAWSAYTIQKELHREVDYTEQQLNLTKELQKEQEKNIENITNPPPEKGKG